MGATIRVERDEKAQGWVGGRRLQGGYEIGGAGVGKGEWPPRFTSSYAGEIGLLKGSARAGQLVEIARLHPPTLCCRMVSISSWPRLQTGEWTFRMPFTLMQVSVGRVQRCTLIVSPDLNQL